MTIEELVKEYERQAEILQNKIDGLRPLLLEYRGEDLLRLESAAIFSLICMWNARGPLTF